MNEGSAYSLPTSQIPFSTPTVSEVSADPRPVTRPAVADPVPVVQQKCIPDINVKLTASRGYPCLVPLLKRCDSPPICTRRADSCVAIRVSSVDDYRNLSRSLELEKFDHWTYRSLGVSPLKVVIRDLPEYVASSDVEGELISLGFPVIAVSQLKSYRNKRSYPILLITLENTIKSKTIINLTALLYSKVKVEPHKKSTSPTQCHRCQRLHHVSILCRTAPKCVKCAGEHLTSDCVKPRKTPPKCANCGLEHTASYRGCIFYKKANLKTSPQKSNTNIQKSNSNSSSPRTFAPAPLINPWNVSRVHEPSTSAAGLTASSPEVAPVLSSVPIASTNPFKTPEPTFVQAEKSAPPQTTAAVDSSALPVPRDGWTRVSGKGQRRKKSKASPSHSNFRTCTKCPTSTHCASYKACRGFNFHPRCQSCCTWCSSCL